MINLDFYYEFSEKHFENILQQAFAEASSEPGLGLDPAGAVVVEMTADVPLRSTRQGVLGGVTTKIASGTTHSQ